MKIVFMGTPDYAVSTLKALYKNGHEIAAVFCQPDKPVGRKQILTPPPVKQFASENGLTVYQPQTLKNEETVSLIKDINPDVIVVVAYGKLLPESILNIPKYGAVNGHASLLPKYRGASPIQWAIVCGEKETGVTTMLMDKGLDTGDILLTAKTAIKENETAEELFDRLCDLTAELMLKTLTCLERGEITPIKQDDKLASYAPIIKKEMGLLNFNKSAEELKNLVYGFNSWPVAYTFLNGKRLKVFTAEIVKKSGEPFSVVSLDGGICVGCGENSLRLLSVQLESAKRMKATELLKGHIINIGDKLGEQLNG